MAFQFLSFIRENRAGALLSGAAALCTYGAWMTGRILPLTQRL